MTEKLLLEVKDEIAYITINNEKEMNSLGASIVQSFCKMIDQCSQNEQVRAVVIRGIKHIFCAGANVSEVAEINNAFDGYSFLKKLNLLFNKIESLSKPVIAAVNGIALGGGCELCLACDLRIASEAARFGFPEVKIGTLPAGGAISRLPSIVGIGKAKELIFLGHQISAHEALEIGLVNFVASVANFEKEVETLAKKLAKRPTLAIGIAKHALGIGIGIDSKGSSFLEPMFGALTFSTKDQKEGMTAFLQKRQPIFKGK